MYVYGIIWPKKNRFDYYYKDIIIAIRREKSTTVLCFYQRTQIAFVEY
jgi:hypothetical protein